MVLWMLSTSALALQQPGGMYPESFRGKQRLDGVDEATVAFVPRAAVKLRAVVALDDDGGGIDAVALEMHQQASGGQLAVGDADLVGVGQEPRQPLSGLSSRMVY